jgi:isochorismate synthase EntC
MARLAARQHPAETGEMLPCRAEPLADRAWMARVIAALRDMGRGQFDKVVLSRSRRIEARKPSRPAASWPA